MAIYLRTSETDDNLIFIALVNMKGRAGIPARPFLWFITKYGVDFRSGWTLS